jgi:hypothetical protein
MFQYALIAVTMLRTAPLSVLWAGLEDHWISRAGQLVISAFA